MVNVMAEYAGVALVIVSGSAFMDTYVGTGPRVVRELFDAVDAHPGPCILLIDEIDSFGGARDGSGGEASLTLNQFLTCLDALPVGVLVVATTNLPGSLSGPLMRAGRLGDRVVVLEKPDLAGRAAIFQIYMRLVDLSVFLCPTGQINPRILAVLAALTVGMVGADLEKIVNEAAIRAGDRDVGPVTLRDLLEAVTAHRKELQLLSQQPAVERGVGRAETLVAAAAATE